MPGMGNPLAGARNSFRNIKLAQNRSKTNPNSKKVAKNVGSELNRLSGVKKDSQFVDRNAHNKLGKEGFLKLLAHQLKNQDPLKPDDQKNMAAELAQFSQLEQMTNMNKTMSKLGDNAPQENKFYGASFLGKEVSTKGMTFEYKGDQSKINLPYSLPKAARTAEVHILDSNNQMVGRFERENMSEGAHGFIWDGLNMDGTPAVKDTYHIKVVAFDETGAQFKGETNAIGKVTGVKFESGQTILEIDNKKKVFLRDVISFQLPAESGIKKAVKSAKGGGAAKSPALQKNAANTYNKVEQQVQ